MNLRIAVIGAGVMGADHARIITRELPGGSLQVICDADGARARALADQCGAADIATDASAAIARDDVDAVLIASPDETHAVLTLAAIAARKPVLCEKPLAPDPADCLRIIEAEIASGRQWVTVGFMRRFDPCYREMKAALDGGRIGAPVMMHNFHRNVAAPPGFSGQMAITNSAPHEFDIARFLLGSEPRSIAAFQPTARRAAGGIAPVFMVIETVDGQLVNVEINNHAAYGYDVRAEMVGETGSVFLNAAAATRVNAQLQSLESYPADWRPRFAEAYRLQDLAWLRSVASGRPDPVAANAWDGYCATVIAMAGARALEQGRAAPIVLPALPDLYRRPADPQ